MATMDSTDASEGPVLNFINKRLRALRKKQNRILQIEDSLAQGKPINKEQEDLIRSKLSISASIDELERLRQPLAAAVAEEITLALHTHQDSASPSETTADLPDEDKENEQKTADVDHQQQDVQNSIVEDLLNLLYFGVMFDVKTQNDFTSMMLTRTHERGCCLTYDYVTDDESAVLLGEIDLDLISRLSGMLISRPTDSVLSHKNALQRCLNNAKLWLANSNEPIDSIPNTTYAGLRAKLNKIMASHYFTTTPEMKATVVMAAAAAGNYGSFQVAAAQESIVPLNLPIQVETHDEQYQEEDDSLNFQGNETHNYESNPVEESRKEECQYEDETGEVGPKEELIRSETEDQNQNGGESKEDQQYAQRRSYQNQRGGGRSGGGGRRGGYSSGRGGRGSSRGGGGGSFQNGQNQFYDDHQSGDYYPRSYYYNNNNRPRGGRSGGGSYNSSSHGSAGAPL